MSATSDRHEIQCRPDAAALAESVAAALVEVLRAVQAEGRVPSVVLTGGTISREIHRTLARLGHGVDWSRVELWWGDERFVAADDPDRNAGQARADLLDLVPVDPGRVHEMPAATDPPSSPADAAAVETAARSYAQVLTDAAPAGDPWFDVLMLGIGPDGHCASLFPGRPEVHAEGVTVGVTDSPKPPPLRVSMTMATLGRARQVWFVAAGAEKAEAVAASYAGRDVDRAPAAGPRGLETTIWWVDEASAADLDGD